MSMIDIGPRHHDLVKTQSGCAITRNCMLLLMTQNCSLLLLGSTEHAITPHQDSTAPSSHDTGGLLYYSVLTSLQQDLLRI